MCLYLSVLFCPNCSFFFVTGLRTLFRSGNISWYGCIFKLDLRCKLSMRADVLHKPWFHHQLTLSIFWHPCFFPLWLLMDLFWSCLIINVIQVPQPQTPYSVAYGSSSSSTDQRVWMCVFCVFTGPLSIKCRKDLKLPLIWNFREV